MQLLDILYTNYMQQYVLSARRVLGRTSWGDLLLQPVASKDAIPGLQSCITANVRPRLDLHVCLAGPPYTGSRRHPIRRCPIRPPDLVAQAVETGQVPFLESAQLADSPGLVRQVEAGQEVRRDRLHRRQQLSCAHLLDPSHLAPPLLDYLAALCSDQSQKHKREESGKSYRAAG